MALALLPCEIFHREFDSKFLISFELASKYNIPVLIGYDKYFNQLIPHFSDCTLLEKSCSTIMWNGRIRPVKDHGGSVLVSDEEGFNNLSQANKYTFINRLDRTAAKSIDLYACWGQIDFDFWSSIPELLPKLIVLGNSRSDLLGQLGRSYYEREITGLNSLFGNYVLVSDNFCVERRGGKHFMPVFNVSDLDQNKAKQEFQQGLLSQARRRDYMSNLLELAATELSDIQFVIRPHPTADPRWWSSRFSSHRNVHVIYHKSIEPWILSSSSLISMGCTTALQASIALKPVIEIADPNADLDKGHNRGFSHLLTEFSVDSSSSLISSILRTQTAPALLSQSKRDLLSNYWYGSQTSLSYKNFCEKIYSISPTTDSRAFIDVLEKASIHYQRNPMLIDDTKWPSMPFSDIQSKFEKLNQILNPPCSLTLQKVAKHLYLIHR